MSKPKAITEHVFPPIPDRSHDWSAVRDGYDGASDACKRTNLIGWGRTEAEAIADLLRQEEE